jgi:Flp pilus assembly protein TadG
MNRSDAMTQHLTALMRLIAQFRRDNEAVAAVEFALVLPFLLLLYLGSIEASSLYTVDRRVAVISGTVADLVARRNPAAVPAFAKSDLKDYFKASLVIMTPYATTGLKQVVSVIKVTSAGVATVEWSCAWNGGTARIVNASYPLPADKQMNVIARGGYLVAAEVDYSYTPMMGLVFTNALDLRSENLFLPRFGVKVNAPTGGCPTP